MAFPQHHLLLLMLPGDVMELEGGGLLTPLPDPCLDRDLGHVLDITGTTFCPRYRLLAVAGGNHVSMYSVGSVSTRRIGMFTALRYSRRHYGVFTVHGPPLLALWRCTGVDDGLVLLLSPSGRVRATLHHGMQTVTALAMCSHGVGRTKSNLLAVALTAPYNHTVHAAVELYTGGGTHWSCVRRVTYVGEWAFRQMCLFPGGAAMVCLNTSGVAVRCSLLSVVEREGTPVPTAMAPGSYIVAPCDGAVLLAGLAGAQMVPEAAAGAEPLPPYLPSKYDGWEGGQAILSERLAVVPGLGFVGSLPTTPGLVLISLPDTSYRKWRLWGPRLSWLRSTSAA